MFEIWIILVLTKNEVSTKVQLNLTNFFILVCGIKRVIFWIRLEKSVIESHLSANLNLSKHKILLVLKWR